MSKKSTSSKQLSEIYTIDQFFDLTPDLVCIASSDGYFKKLNPAWQKTLGYTLDELLIQPLESFIHPEDIEATRQEVEKQKAGNPVIHFANRFRTKEGPYRWLEWNITVSIDGESFYAMARDITERKQAEERFTLAMEASQDGIWDWDLNTGKVYYSPAYFTMLGYLPNELPAFANTWVDLIHPDDIQKALNANQECIENRTERFSVEFRMKAKDGRWRWILGKGKAVLRDPQGTALRMVGTHTDITELKQAEEALRETESTNHAIVNNSPIGISVRSKTGQLISANDAWRKLWAIPSQELQHDQKRSRTDLNFDERDDYLKPYQREVRRVYEQGGHLHLPELKTTHPRPGAAEWISQHFYAIPDDEGNVARVVILTEDITERKRAEEILRQNDEKMRTVLDTMEEGLALNELIFDENGNAVDYRILEVNAAFEQISFLTREQAIGKTATEIYFMSPEQITAFWQAHKGNDHSIKTDMFIPEINKWRHISTSKINDNKFVTLFFDNTEQKGFEIALRKSEERYQNFIRQSFEAISRTEFDHPIDISLPVEEQIDLIYQYAYMAECNQAMADMYKVPSPEAFIGTRLIDAHGGKDNPVNRATFRRFIENGYKSINDETTEYRADGSPVWFLSNTVGTIEDGHLVRLWGTGLDITERKLGEKALRESEERFAKAFEYAPIGKALVSPDGQWLQVNRAVCEMLGYSEEELLATTFQALTHPEDLDKDLEYVQKMLRGEITTYQMQKRYFRKSGEIVWGLLSVSMIRDEAGKPQYFISQVVDITDRKLADEQLKHSLAEKETLLRELYHRTKNNMAVIIALLDMQANEFSDPQLRQVFIDAQNRIHSMALVHQKLYEASDLSQINLKEYINELILNLLKSYNISSPNIDIKARMDDVFVIIDTAIPCGLVLNELISNMFKYAFPIGTKGEIQIQLHRLENGEIELSIADNGVGVPTEFDFRRDGHLGIQNVFVLVENQLQGQIEFDTTRGVACHLKFHDIFYEPRV